MPGPIPALTQWPTRDRKCEGGTSTSTCPTCGEPGSSDVSSWKLRCFGGATGEWTRRYAVADGRADASRQGDLPIGVRRAIGGGLVRPALHIENTGVGLADALTGVLHDNAP